MRRLSLVAAGCLLCAPALPALSQSPPEAKAPALVRDGRGAEWEPRAPAPLALREALTATVQGRAFVLGGFRPDFTVSAATTAYDPATDTWQEGYAPMPLPVTHTMAVAAGGDVWLTGGFAGDNPGVATDRVQVYGVAAGRWRDGPTLPTPMASHGAALLGRRLHVFGGLLPDRRTDVGHHFVLDLDDPDAGWRKAAELPEPRNHLGAESVGGRIYAIGGQNGHDGVRTMTAFLHAYDPSSDTWTRLADLLTPKSHFEPGTAVFDGRILIAGGDLGPTQQTRQIDLYDTLTDTWTRQPGLPVSLSSPVGHVFGDLLVVSQGSNGNGTYATAWGRAQPRSPSDVLAFSPDTLHFGAAVRSAEVLLWTLSGDAEYQIRSDAAWLSTYSRGGQAGPTGAEVAVDVHPGGLAPGTHTATLTATAAGYRTATLYVTLEVTGAQDGAVARINAGGPDVVAGRARWQADALFEGGRFYANPAVTEIDQTDADTLYVGGRTSTSPREGFSYRIPVPEPGLYTLRLHFAEVYWGLPGGRRGGVGSRVFDVLAEGSPLLTDYDVTREAGPATAIVEQFDVTVSDGALDLQFLASADQPAIAAIELEAAQPGRPALAAPSPDAVAVHPPVPNPSTAEVTFVIDLPAPATVEITLYDPLGRRVREWAEALEAGRGLPVRMDVRGLAPGVYLYRARAGAGLPSLGQMTVVR